jgi:hypothetical protein
MSDAIVPIVDESAQKEANSFATDLASFEYEKQKEIFAKQKSLVRIVLWFIGISSFFSGAALSVVYYKLFVGAIDLTDMPLTFVALVLAPAGLATLLLAGALKQVFAWGKADKDDKKANGDTDSAVPNGSAIKAATTLLKDP